VKHPNDNSNKKPNTKIAVNNIRKLLEEKLDREGNLYFGAINYFFGR